MLRATIARFYASPKPPSQGRSKKPHVHNPLYRKQVSLSLARSQPLAVRLRRAQRNAQQRGLPPSTDKKPTQRLHLDEFLRRRDEQPLKQIRIPRIRGITVAYHQGKPYTVAVQGKKVYLPNLVIRLVRNHTPPDQPYNPWQATFRVPKNLTKTDIRSYLMAVYGVQTTYIRTDNYRAELSRQPENRNVNNHSKSSIASYKRAVVGLVEPFYYPLRMEDMEPEARERREAEIEDKLQVKMFQEMETVNNQNRRLATQMPKHNPSAYWTTEVKLTRAKKLKQDADERTRRETLIAQQVEKWQRKRAAGESITLISPKTAEVPAVIP
ncbi:mitochondrial ribosomal protein L23 [Mycena amicta]|nr:mitochondrial ribosomal protein L23 [Mycena amicta]